MLWKPSGDTRIASGRVLYGTTPGTGVLVGREHGSVPAVKAEKG